MMWWGSGFGWGWMIFGGLAMLLFWGGLIALVVLAVRAFAGAGQPANLARPVLSRAEASPASMPDTALETLKARYARGEITKEEYEDIRRDLTV